MGDENNHRYVDLFIADLQLIDCYNQLDFVLIREAIDFAKNCHKGQWRASGEPYYHHPLEVAKIVSKYDCNTDIIIAAILHDTIEDSVTTFTELSFLFNKKIARIVHNVTKFNYTNHYKVKISEEKILEKLYIQNNNSSILVKLCDRLHNLSTIDALPKHKQHKIALQTIRTLIPLAKALGIEELETELSELALTIIASCT
ncbi:MAG: HD domain-containing protein [Rickettsiaceae bacterium]